MASMLVFHTGDPGSIPGLGIFFRLQHDKNTSTINMHNTKTNLNKARLAHLAERRLSKSKVLSSILKVGTIELTIQQNNSNRR